MTTTFTAIPAAAIDAALAQLQKAEPMTNPQGAALYDNNTGEVVSSGYNTAIGPPEGGRVIHAAAMAVGGVEEGANFSDLSMIILRETIDGDITEVGPCHKCKNLLRATGVEEVYYSGG